MALRSETLRSALSSPRPPLQMDLTDILPTPPTTQAETGAPTPQLHGSNQGIPLTRHPEFYYTDSTLMDPVILQVCRSPSLVVSFQTLTSVRPKIPYTGSPSSISHKEATSSRRLSRLRMTTHRRGGLTIVPSSSLRPLPAQCLMYTCVTTRCKSNRFSRLEPQPIN